MALMLSTLLGVRQESRFADVAINRLVVDSRQVGPGDLFVAIPGTRLDGRQFIADAVKAGAAAVLTAPGADGVGGLGVPVIEHSHIRRAYAEMAALAAGQQPETIVGVTGTNGKTSVADFTRQIWADQGVGAGSMGTLGVLSDAYQVPGGLTTPDPVALHGHLAALAKAGVSHVALEASSHGLSQNRLDGLDLAAGAFTNLSRDHLDYHVTETAYLHAKGRLFADRVKPGGAAVVMQTGPASTWITDLARGQRLQVITVGDIALETATGEQAESVDLFIRARSPHAHGQRIELRAFGALEAIDLPLIGDFQAHNWLVAAGLAVGTGSALKQVLASADKMAGVPGRMDLMGSAPAGGAVYVDYAHTPDGLKTVLTAAKAHLKGAGRLHVVFGCGGDRDAGKRPIMGQVADDLADHLWITDDNPRSEEASAIRADVMAGVAARHRAREIADRSAAIGAAIDAMGAEDVLIVAGKGHETGQIIGDETIAYSDIETIRGLLGANAQPRAHTFKSLD